MGQLRVGDLFEGTYNGATKYWLCTYVEYDGIQYTNIGYLSNINNYIQVENYQIGFKPVDKIPFSKLNNPKFIKRFNAAQLATYEREANMKRKLG